MLSKAIIKWINSLELKKKRDKEGLFVAEGLKTVSDLLTQIKCKYIATYQQTIYDELRKIFPAIDLISEEEYKKISFQKSPQGVLAVFEQPKHTFNTDLFSKNLVLALDEIQDPGNLGTIVRLADWFGILDVFCTYNSVDIYNPKTVQATMGAISTVKVHYVDLPDLFRKLDTEIPIYGAFMDGKNIYTENLTPNGIIVMGNEGKGISAELLPFISKKIAIPNFSVSKSTSESLNVSIATSIIVSEFKRRD